MTEFQRVTPRGFGYSEFVQSPGYGGDALQVQESSIATGRALWIGQGRSRAHVEEPQVRELRDLLTSWLGDDESEDSDERASLEREGRETVRKGTALAAALAELDRDGYVHATAGGRFRPTGIRPDKRLYSQRTIDALGEFIPLDYTGYATYGRTT